MSLVRWFTQNVADTRGPTHPDLGPLTLPGPADAALAAVAAAAGTLPGWAVAETGPAGLHLTRTTPVLKFTDDIRVSCEPTGDGVAVHARSQSRVGKGDLGQNRRNVLELWRAVHARKA